MAGYFILSIRAHGCAAGPMAGFDAPGSMPSSSRTVAGTPYSLSISVTRAWTRGSNGLLASTTKTQFAGNSWQTGLGPPKRARHFIASIVI